MIYSKTLDPQDYQNFNNSSYIENILNLLEGIAHRYEHPHRAWEYGLSLYTIQNFFEQEEISLLDVGGGGSVFDPVAASYGMHVTVVDPGDCSGWVAGQNQRLIESNPAIQPINYIQEDFMTWQSDDKFDVVTCLSVIEHVSNDFDFISKMASFVKKDGLLIITTDYHESGMPQCDGHIITYNEDSLKYIAKKLDNLDYLVDSNESKVTNYVDGGDYVNGYNFASLILHKIK